MNNATSNQSQAKHSHVFVLISGGSLFGITVGIVGYLTAMFVFTSLESQDYPSYSRNGQMNGSDARASSWMFSEDLSQAELLRVSEVLGNLNQRELIELIEKSSTQSWTSRLDTVQEMLIENLVHISPEDAIASVEYFDVDRRRFLLRQVFSQWSQIDFHSALAAAITLPRTDQQAVVNSILIDRNDLTEQELSSATLILNVESELANLEQERLFYELIAEEPIKAIRSLANDNVDDYLQIDLFRQAVEKWFQVDGLNILVELNDLDISNGVYSELFDQLTRQDRVAALDSFQNIDLNSDESFGNQLIYSWAQDDARGAFQAVRGLPKSHYRNSLFLSVIFYWGLRTPDEALDHMMEIPRLYRADAVSSAAIALANEDPLRAIDRISNYRLVPGTNVDRAIESVVRNWAEDAPKLAFEWVINNSQERSKYRHELLRKVLPRYALDEPEQAMTVAVQEFNPDYSGWSLESQIISSLLFANRLDTAIELVDQVRDDIKLTEYINVGAELVKQKRIDGALTLLGSLSEDEQSEYLYRVSSRLTIYDLASDVLEIIEKVPSPELQANVAERLLTDGSVNSDFTAKQIEILQSFIPE